MSISLEPWFSVAHGEKAVAFYKSAFGAEETYRLETPDRSIVVNLKVENASFWVSGGPEESKDSPDPLGGSTVRMILITKDPDKLFNQAIEAGAKEIFPIGEEYGWKLGRVIDPFGLHWEIGYPLN